MQNNSTHNTPSFSQKEECIAIAKIIEGDGLSDNYLLWYLPDYVFGKTLNIERVYNNNYVVYDFDGKNKMEYSAIFR